MELLQVLIVLGVANLIGTFFLLYKVSADREISPAPQPRPQAKIVLRRKPFVVDDERAYHLERDERSRRKPTL